MSQFPTALPGIGTALTATPRTVFLVETGPGDFAPIGGLIDGQAARDVGNSPVSELRAGLILGKVTNTGTASGAATASTIGDYGAAIIGTITTAITAGGTVTSGTVTATAATELVRRVGSVGTLVLTGASSSTGTVISVTLAYSAVNTTTGVITTSNNTNGWTAGTWIGANDGSAVPTSVLVGPWPIKVTDGNGANLQVPNTLIPITFKPYAVSSIVDYPASANTTLVTFLKTKLRIPVPAAAFSDDY